MSTDEDDDATDASRPNEAVLVLKRLLSGALTVVDGDGWPASVIVEVPGHRVEADLYLRKIGGSSRRNPSERRFQNPTGGVAIEDPGERRALLWGVWQELGVERSVIVAFDAYRRVGKTTRFSLFMPLGLLQEAASTGFATHVTGSGETLFAFQPSHVGQYIDAFVQQAPWEIEARSDQVATARVKRVAEPSPTQRIAKALGTRLPKVPRAGLDPAWLAAFADKAGVSVPEAPRPENASAILREVVTSLGGVLPPEVNDEAALVELADLVELRTSIQDELGERKRPLLANDDLLQALYSTVFPETDPPDNQTEIAKSILSRATELPVGELPKELLTPHGLSKLAFAEVLGLVERLAEDPEEAKEIAEEDEEESPADVAAELALTAPIDGQPLNLHLPSLMQNIDYGDLVLNPAWQRGDVWPLSKKRALIESLLLGIPLPSLILHWEKDKSITVIDGKQRLTAIHQFFKGEWPLGKHGSTSKLAEASNKYFSNLPTWARRKIMDTQVAVLRFEGLTASVLYKIFELYNVTGIRLNAVEIRNAVFHAHPIHEMAFAMAGEGSAEPRLFLSTPQEQSGFTGILRATVAPGGQAARYATLDFLCRYLAYSRAPVSPRTGAFAPESTAKVIRLYFETTPIEDPSVVAREIAAVFAATTKLFGAAGVDPFGMRQNGKLRFNRLRATAAMTVSRIAVRALDAGVLDEAGVVSAIKRMAVDYPPKQTTKTIWNFHARFVLAFVREAALSTPQIESLGFTHLVTSLSTLV